MAVERGDTGRRPVAGQRTVATACPLDCPDGCSLVATLDGERLVALDGSDRNPLTAGFLCDKVRGFAAHLYGDARVRTPLIREPGAPKGRPGGFRQASWDEALDLVTGRIRAVLARSGGQAILPLNYDGSNGPLTAGTLDQRLFRRLGATKLERTVCAAAFGAASLAMYGRMPGIPLEDYEHADLVVAWGVNPTASGIHFLPPVLRARARGGKLVVVDPRRTKLARRADLHLALRPGTDLALALAVIRWLLHEGAADLDFLATHTSGLERLEERAEIWTPEAAARTTGLAATEIEAFARLYAEAPAAALRCGWGLERNRNGGQAVCAVLALPAVAGKFGVRGGGFTASNKRAWDLVDPNADEPPPRRAVNQNKVGRALTEGGDPPIELLFVYDHNPAETLPDARRVRRGLAREDLFTVVFDAVHTATADYADVVLPATTFLEHDELVLTYGAYALQRARPVVPPVGEARSNLQVFGELLDRLGLAHPGEAREPDALVAELLAREPAAARALDADGVAFPSTGPSPVQFVDLFPRTSDGLVHLFPEELDRESPVGLYVYREDPGTDAYPLALISPSTSKRISSTFGQLHREIVPLDLHPEDAAERGIEDGDRVRVHNELGELQTYARVTDATRPGVVVLPKGIWAHNTLDGNTSNMLTPDALTDVGGGAVFNDARVQVVRLARREGTA